MGRTYKPAPPTKTGRIIDEQPTPERFRMRVKSSGKPPSSIRFNALRACVDYLYTMGFIHDIDRAICFHNNIDKKEHKATGNPRPELFDFPKRSLYQSPYMPAKLLQNKGREAFRIVIRRANKARYLLQYHYIGTKEWTDSIFKRIVANQMYYFERFARNASYHN